MLWHWKVRIYNESGHYGVGQFSTVQKLEHIDLLQDFYYETTGCKMILEGMSAHKWAAVPPLEHVFHLLWSNKQCQPVP